MITMSQIGLLSNLELWLGIIVACLPTMAPFARAHLQPSLSKLVRTLYGSSSPSTAERTPREQLRTFGSSGPALRGNTNYTELSERSTYADQDNEELVPVANKTPKVYTPDFESSNTQTAPSRDRIYVQKQFQTFDV